MAFLIHYNRAHKSIGFTQINRYWDIVGAYRALNKVAGEYGYTNQILNMLEVADG